MAEGSYIGGTTFDTPAAEALKLLPSRNSQFTSVKPFGIDDDFINSSISNPWLFGADSSNEMSIMGISPEELLLLVGLPEVKDLSMMTALPEEECGRIRTLNASLWQLLTKYTNSSGEFKCLGHAPVLTYGSTVRAVVLAVMAVLSFVGNVWTIVSIRMNRSGKRSHQTWSAVYTLILHLSIVDLLVTMFCIVGEAAWSFTVEWLAGNAECKIFKFLQIFSLYLSTFVLVLIGVDRFVVVKYPMKSLNTAKRLNRLIVLIWILSLILSIPQFLFPYLERLNRLGGERDRAVHCLQ
ncbi:gonadotropin-releasing hormone receptor-like [Periplaneta americana]|uniref:gonadotropin-releasing hormone receptor-like n=1 Tax=Periplaneta americana TaxID=6978 RepID=UPI0037E92FB2